MFVYRRYSAADWEAVRRLAGDGLSEYEIARRTGFPRSTINNWKTRSKPPGSARSAEVVDPGALRNRWGPEYAYLLGVYLGDGHLWETSPRAYRLGIYCDAAYPGVIAEVKVTMEAVVPDATIRINKRQSRCIVVLASSRAWPYAFPQHGPGRKHERPIVLEPWQREITGGHPEMLLRGLIHSDGCRCMNRFRTKLPSGRIGEYEYPRYFFSNLSEDIRTIFCEHCDLLGIRWTQSNARNISVSHRHSVALLDGFVGPKR